MDRRGPVFSQKDLSVLAAAVEQAEELVGEHFGVPCFGPDRYVYEVATLKDLTENERAEGVFAHLVFYVRKRPGPAHERRPHWFYRVCLQDDTILAAVRRAEGAFELFDLLLFVMTHELVHVVRFERFERHFDVLPGARQEEERIVDSLTAAILGKLHRRQLQHICSLYVAAPDRPSLFKTST